MNLRSWKIVLDRVCRKLITRIERSNVDSSPQTQRRKKRTSERENVKALSDSCFVGRCLFFPGALKIITLIRFLRLVKVLRTPLPINRYRKVAYN